MSQVKSSRATALRKVPLFADLSERELKFLAERAVPRQFETGKVVLSEGEPCEGFQGLGGRSRASPDD
jgi:hypothetical protein